MALGQFTLKAKGKASSFDPRVNIGKPLIVVPREFRANFTTQRFPNPKDVVIVDVVDLSANNWQGQIHISVIWGGGAMVDAIKEHVPTDGTAPTPLPVKIQRVDPNTGGNSYYVLIPLEGQELQLAQLWDQKFPTRVDEARVAHEAEQAAGAGAPAGNSMAAALAAMQGGVQQNQAQYQPPAPVQNDQAAQVAALQAQLAALQGGQTTQAAPVQVQQEAPAQPVMSTDDLEAAIAALK